MRNLHLTILIGTLLLNSCSNSKTGSLSTTVVNGKSVPLLKFSEIRDTITLTLSQLFDDVSFIKLETTEDNKITRGKWSIGDKYIVGFVRQSGLFQFTSDGKFIRKLANYGKGPQEIYYPIWTISKDESHIYIYDLLKPKNFLCFDLNSGLFDKEIPIPLEGLLKNIYFINDSVLICAPIIGTGNPAGNYYLFWQKLSGELIEGVPARTSSKPIVPSENLLYPVGDNFHYRPIYSDTIFQVNGYQIEPYIVLDADNTRINPENEIGKTNSTIFIETTNFIIIQTDKITSKEVIGENTIGYQGSKKYFYVDKLHNRPYVISKFNNDLLGQQQDPISFEDQSSNTKYISIEAISLLKRISAIRRDPSIKIKDRNTILNLEDGLTENDNPVLIIGTLEKN